MRYKTSHVTRHYLHRHVVTPRLPLWLGLRNRIFEMHASRLSTAALSDSIIKDQGTIKGPEICCTRDGWLQDETI